MSPNEEIETKTDQQFNAHYRDYYLKCKSNTKLPSANFILNNYHAEEN